MYRQNKMIKPAMIEINTENTVNREFESNVIKLKALDDKNYLEKQYCTNNCITSIEKQLYNDIILTIKILNYYYPNISHNSKVYLSKIKVYNHAKYICILLKAIYIDSNICIHNDEAFLKMDITTQDNKKYGIYFRPCNICICSNIIEYK